MRHSATYLSAADLGTQSKSLETSARVLLMQTSVIG